MREYCLLTPAGAVVNMSMCYGDRQPYLSEEQIEKGYRWEPVGRVSQTALQKYQYWNERP